ncbi:MAG: hypothetical protein ACOYZ8_06605 [Chloroflexota bacterium]
MNRILKIPLLLLTSLLLFLGLNFRQLHSAWTVWAETLRLSAQALKAPGKFQNPEPTEDRFNGELSPQFWKFTSINGAGQVSNEMAWHAAAMNLERGLSIQHYPDPDFQSENADLFQKPAADRYNNVTLVGASIFRPTLDIDIVLKFSAKASENFYGSAGVIFQPEGTLRKDGLFAGPFDMFGFAVIGDESSFQGINGPVCYLALDWSPVRVQSMNVDARAWREYEIRLRWISPMEWMGIVSVDGIEMCRMSLPAFGAVEVQVWSDNALVTTQPRQWWEIAPALELNYQDGGEKQFDLGFIRIFAEAR